MGSFFKNSIILLEGKEYGTPRGNVWTSGGHQTAFWGSGSRPGKDLVGLQLWNEGWITEGSRRECVFYFFPQNPPSLLFPYAFLSPL